MSARQHPNVQHTTNSAGHSYPLFAPVHARQLARKWYEGTIADTRIRSAKVSHARQMPPLRRPG